MNRNQFWVLVLLIALAVTGTVLAQSSIRYDLGWHLLSGGGGSRGSAHFQIDDVLGQWADGRSASDRYQIDPGFWGQGRVIGSRDIYLPLAISP